MTDKPKTRWPKTPGGTIDWEKAFEDPGAGLIPLILQAHSPAALRECTIAVISQLYTRKDDPSEVERFVAQLNAMVPDEIPPKHLPRIADAVVSILRQIKADNIRKALEFEVTKASAAFQDASAGAAGVADTAKPVENRRSVSEQPKLTALAKAAAARKRQRIMLIAGGIAAVLIMAGTGTAVFMADAPQREVKRKAILLVEQIQAVGRGEAIGTHVHGGALRAGRVGEYAAVVVEGLTPNQCASAGWVFANKGNVMVNGVMPAKASLTTLSALCGSKPEGATLTWIPRPEDRQKGSKAKK